MSVISLSSRKGVRELTLSPPPLGRLIITAFMHLHLILLDYVIRVVYYSNLCSILLRYAINHSHDEVDYHLKCV